jgi:putative transposase
MPCGSTSASTSAFATFNLFAERGVVVSHGAVRQWCNEVRAAFAAGLRRRRVRVGDKWHVDEVALKIRGKRHSLWRAVDGFE